MESADAPDKLNSATRSILLVTKLANLTVQSTFNAIKSKGALLPRLRRVRWVSRRAAHPLRGAIWAGCTRQNESAILLTRTLFGNRRSFQAQMLLTGFAAFGLGLGAPGGTLTRKAYVCKHLLSATLSPILFGTGLHSGLDSRGQGGSLGSYLRV